jgi:hypothetical protein
MTKSRRPRSGGDTCNFVDDALAVFAERRGAGQVGRPRLSLGWVGPGPV